MIVEEGDRCAVGLPPHRNVVDSKGELDIPLEYYDPMPLWVLRGFGDAVSRIVSASDLAVPAALVFNFRKKPMDLKPFPEAVASSLGYERIVQVVTDGQGGKASRRFVPPAHGFRQ